MSERILCLLGPTAVGKSALACALAQRWNLEIISVDSVMIYRGFDIGTAKPDLNLRQTIPHHLIDIRDPIDLYSVAEFRQDLRALCKDLLARGKTPLLTGGTMMYFHALQRGLSTLPESQPQIREEILHKAAQLGWSAMHQDLARIDAAAAARIHPHDAQRIGRALEVYLISGESISQLQEKSLDPLPYQWMNCVVVPEDRAWLHQRIAVRFHEMLRDGFIDEVRNLKETWQLELSHPAWRSVGYRQVDAYLSEGFSLEALAFKTIAATRQLAKRQLTWLRSWPNAQIFLAEDPKLLQKLTEFFGAFLDGA